MIVAVVGSVTVVESAAFLGAALFFSCVEIVRRWWRRYTHWKPYITGSTNNGQGEIRVGVERRHKWIRLSTLDPCADEFGEMLAEAESAARQRCIQLNASDKALARKLPK